MRSRSAASFNYWIKYSTALVLHYSVTFLLCIAFSALFVPYLSTSDTFSSCCNILQSYDENQMGANALMGSVGSEQRGLTGSKVSVQTVGKERGLLFCPIVCDLYGHIRTCIPCFSSARSPLSAQSPRFYGIWLCCYKSLSKV